MFQDGRRLRAALVTALSLLLMVLAAGPGFADTAPADPTNPATPVTVSADVLPTAQVNGVVWQQLVIGNTVYAAGSFSSARPAGSALGVNEVSRSNLLAYDLTTGALKTGFVANLNAQAKTLAASPDGTRLYVGGDFTTVNGVSRSRVAALNPATGAVLAGFAPVVNARVGAIVATSTTVYLGGSFSTVNGTARSFLASVTSTGGLLAAFAPKVAGGYVQAMVLSPDKTKLVVAGSFTTVNGSGNPGYGLGAVNPSTGASLAFAANTTVRNAGANSAILSLSADSTTVYGTGYVYGAGGNLEGAFAANWSDLKLKWLEDCHGDSYGVYPSSTAVYVAGHQHFCGNVGGFPETTPRSYHHAVAFSKAVTGTVKTNTGGSSYVNFAGQPAPTLQAWYPDLNTGTYTGQGQGPWTVTGSGGYVLYGGEFTTVNGTKQQGLVRFATKDMAPNLQGPRASGTDFQPTANQTSADTVRLTWPANWDRDNANLTYTIYQDKVSVGSMTVASSFWNRPTVSFDISGVTAGTHTYKVTAADASGNLVTSPIVNNQPPPTVTAKTPAAGATGVAIAGTTGSAPISATFSEDVTGVSATSFTLKQGSTAVSAGVSYDAATRTATLTPTDPLTADKTYTLGLTAAIKSTTGGILTAQNWTFITGPSPTVVARTPSPNAANVTRAANVTATLSEAVTGLPTTPTTSSLFTIKQTSTGAAVASAVSYAATTRVATLNPAATLAANTQYTIAMTSGIKDTAGNPLVPLSWTYTTGPS